VGVLLSANRAVRLLTNPLAGWIAARIGITLPFVLALGVGAATTFAYGIANGFAALLAARLVWGLCWSFIRLGGLLTTLDAASPADRGYALGFYSGASRIGTLVAVAFGGLLSDSLGFSATTGIFGVITLCGVLAVARGAPTPRRAPAPATLPFREPEREPESEPPRADVDLPDSARADARRRGFVYATAFLISLTGSLGVATLGLWLLQQAPGERQLGPLVLGVASVNGLLLGGRFTADLFWAPLAGRLSDRVGRHPALIASAVAAAVALAALSASSTLLTISISSLVLAFGSTALRVSLDAAIGDLAPEPVRARVLSSFVNFSDLGAACGPLLAYQLAGVVGLAAVYRGGSVVLFCVGVMFAWLARSARRPQRAAATLDA
jgi:MFS family permease